MGIRNHILNWNPLRGFMIRFSIPFGGGKKPKPPKDKRNPKPRIPMKGLILAVAALSASGCATTLTRNRSEDGAVQTLIRAEFGGRILNHGASASYSGQGWSMEAGDSVEEMAPDPDTVRAAVEGAIRGISLWKGFP